MEDQPRRSILHYLNDIFHKKIFNVSEDKPKKSEELALSKNLEEYFDTTIREVMVPRTHMITVEKNSPISDVMNIITKSGHSKIPVQDKKRDNIVGIIHSKDLFKYFNTSKNLTVTDVMRKPFFASYSQPIHHLLSNFKKEHVHIAIVVDEHGGVDGLITLDDVLDELVGDVPDQFEMDNEPTYDFLEPNLIEMDADFPLDDFNKLYEKEFDKEGIETIGGYICHTIGKIPEEKETFEIEELAFLVKQRNERRLIKICLPAPKTIVLDTIAE